MPNNDSISNKNFWWGFWGAIVFLLIIYLSAVKEANKISLSDDGKRVVLANEIVEVWKNNLPSIFGTIGEEFGGKAKAEIETFIDEKIDAVFDPLYGQIPKFAEFHYSVMGEYTEIFAALSGAMGNRVQDILFKEVGFENNLRNELAEITQFSKDKISGAGKRVNDDIQNKIELGNDDMNLLTRTLELTSQDVENRFSSLEYSTIRGAGVIAGLTATGSVLAKTMGKKLATKVAGKVAVKTAAKAGGVLGGAGVGAAVCAPGGPIASAFCGFFGGVAVWLAVDKFIVEIDEHFNRDDFEKDLRDMVDEQKQEIKNGLKASYSAVIAIMMEEQKNKLKSVTPKELISN